MDFNEEFNKRWKEAVEEYETIPDKSKISDLDKEFARGFFFALDEMKSLKDNYLIFDDEREDILQEIQRQVIKRYDEYAQESMDSYFDELLTGILDNYVE